MTTEHYGQTAAQTDADMRDRYIGPRDHLAIISRHTRTQQRGRGAVEFITSFDVYRDDYAADERTVVRLHYVTRAGGKPAPRAVQRVEVTRLSGYDKGRHCWTREVGTAQVELTTAEAQRLVRALLAECERGSGRPAPLYVTAIVYFPKAI